jgi:orotate phosphoribosyltransferase
MRHCKRSLRDLIIEDCLKKDNCTIDLSQLYLRGKGAYLIGKTIYHHTKELDFDAIGGHGVEVIPLVATTAVHFWKREHRIKEGFWVCPGQGVEGRITKLHKVIVIEDVCTTGDPAALAVQTVQEFIGCKVVGVIAVVDREEGAKERFKEMGIMFDSIFKANDILDRATNGGWIKRSVDGI